MQPLVGLKLRTVHTLIGMIVGYILGDVFVPPSLGDETYFSAINEILPWKQWIVMGCFGGVSFFLSPYVQASKYRGNFSIYGMTMSALLIGGFLVPMSFTGATQAKLYHIPAPVRNQYRISCLFTHASRAWHTVHYEVRMVGQLRWEEGPLQGYFDLDMFGYRSRLNRIVLASRYKNKRGMVYGRNKIRLEEMGHFIADRWSVLNPDDSRVQEVRFTRVAHKTGEEHCMARERWSRPPLDTIAKSKHDLIHTVRIRNE